MNPRVKAVKPNLNYTITLLFTNGETKSFDVRPYLDKGIFRELKDIRLDDLKEDWALARAGKEVKKITPLD